MELRRKYRRTGFLNIPKSTITASISSSLTLADHKQAHKQAHRVVQSIPLCYITVIESTVFKIHLHRSPLLCPGSTEYTAQVLRYLLLEYPICFLLAMQETPNSCRETS